MNDDTFDTATGEPVTQSAPDSMAEQAVRILGPEAPQLREKCRELGIDADSHIMSVAAHLNDMEAELEEAKAGFQNSVAPELWPCIDNALAVNHVVENSRRALMAMLDVGILTGPAAGGVSDVFANLSGVLNNFVNATLTSLLGRTVAGFDEATVQEKIVEPFNDIMTLKRSIFDFIGNANAQFTQQIIEAIAKQAQGAAEQVADVTTAVH